MTAADLNQLEAAIRSSIDESGEHVLTEADLVALGNSGIGELQRRLDRAHLTMWSRTDGTFRIRPKRDGARVRRENYQR